MTPASRDFMDFRIIVGDEYLTAGAFFGHVLSLSHDLERNDFFDSRIWECTVLHYPTANGAPNGRHTMPCTLFSRLQAANKSSVSPAAQPPKRMNHYALVEATRANSGAP
jgi:hypothetical protein